MDRRLLLNQVLKSVPGVKAVYFQAPSADKMIYPCIVYALDDRKATYANNSPYRNTKRYQVTIIDREADSGIPDEVAKLPLTSFSRRFVANQLHHEVFNIHI